MLSDVIQGAYDVLTVDARLLNDVGTNTKVNDFGKTLEDEPTCTPFITFGVDPVSSFESISLGKKVMRIIPLKILCGITNYDSVWESQLALDALLKNVEAILNENPKLNNTAYDSKIIQEVYGYIFDNEGNPFYKVCEITLEVKEVYNTNVC